ncbi:class I SAM-dependent methyltransferase [Pseudomonadota bacterium]
MNSPREDSDPYNRPPECDYSMQQEWYAENISTPSTDPVYFRTFIAPLICHAQTQKEQGRPVRIIDVACGHANELKHLIELPDYSDLHITGLDISEASIESARKTFADKYPGLSVDFVVGDAQKPPTEIEPDSYDVGLLVNAMAYKPGHILRSVFNALKPGGRCTVNFMIPGKNPKYVEYYVNKYGCKIKKKEIKITCNSQEEVFTLFVTDFCEVEDPEVRKLQQQAFFESEADLKRLIALIGFEIVDHQRFVFSSVANPHNDFDIFTLQKPEEKPVADETQATVRERLLSITDS